MIIKYCSQTIHIQIQLQAFTLSNLELLTTLLLLHYAEMTITNYPLKKKKSGLHFQFNSNTFSSKVILFLSCKLTSHRRSPCTTQVLLYFNETAGSQGDILHLLCVGMDRIRELKFINESDPGRVTTFTYLGCDLRYSSLSDFCFVQVSST